MVAFPTAEVIARWMALLEHAVDERFLMHGRCDRCGHTAPLDATSLAKRFPTHTSLNDLAKRLVCMKCFAAGRPFRSVDIHRTEMDGSEYDKMGNDFARWQAGGCKGPSPGERRAAEAARMPHARATEEPATGDR